MSSIDVSALQTGISIIFSFVPIALMIVGWKVLFGNAQRIATRSETFSIVNDLIGQLNEARERCVDFWSSAQKEDFDAELEWQKLKPYITSVRSSKDFLDANRNIKVENMKIVQFRRALSLNMSNLSADDFEAARSNSITNIHKATQAFKEELLIRFEESYPAKF
jgi:hypothetical protein